jgi:uncharacterized membrane protein YdjX (TVP38/TMEM64 family)
MTGRTVSRLALLLAIVAAAALAFVHREQLEPSRLQALVESAGVFGPLLHIAAFALATVLFVPGAIFALTGGALFGPLWGTLWNVLGATLGAALSFLVARHLAADLVARRSAGIARRLIEGVEAEGWRFVALTRLIPFVPFNALNYALGVTRIGFAQYLLATLVCMIPGSAAYTWLGHAGKEALAGDAAAIRWALIALGVLALMAFLPRLVRRVRG